MKRTASKLTNRERQCLDFCTAYMAANNGRAPMLSEIGTAMDNISKGNVHTFLTRLQNLGYIKRTKNKMRAITICDPVSSAGSIAVDDAPGGAPQAPSVARSDTPADPVT